MSNNAGVLLLAVLKASNKAAEAAAIHASYKTNGLVYSATNTKKMGHAYAHACPCHI